MRLVKEIFTWDNLLHSLVSVLFVVLVSLVLLKLGVSLQATPLSLAAFAGLLLYVREAWQVGWDWSLRGSLHKHMEWIVGTVAGFVAAGVMMVVT